MVATDFEFNGTKLTDVNWRIVSFGNNDDNEVAGGGEVTFNTSKAINGKRWNYVGRKYETQYSFPVQIMKFKCPHEIGEISTREQAFIHSWLVRSDGYKLFRFMFDGYEDVYYNAQVALQWYKISGKIVGATLTLTCDAPWGYSDIQTADIVTNTPFNLYNDSDDLGYIIPDEIEIGISSSSAGNLEISNNLESIYSMGTYPNMKINNCKAGENIIVSGLTKQIYTDNVTHEKSIADDYNYKPIRLINMDNMRQNIITVSGCNANVHLTYRTVRKVVM